MLKGLHLLAALFVIFVLCIYFNLKSQIKMQPDNEVVAPDKHNVSAYEQFCANNKDVNCSRVENIVANSNEKEFYYYGSTCCRMFNVV